MPGDMDMDVQTMLIIVGLLVSAFGSLLLVLWNQQAAIRKAQADHELYVARRYVTSDEHERRMTKEIDSLKDLIERFEKNMTDLFALNQKKGAA